MILDRENHVAAALAVAGTGNLLAKVQIVVPTDLSDEDKETLARIAEQRGGDPRADLIRKAAQ